MHRIRITHAPETIDGEVMAHWQSLLGCEVEADGQSVAQIRKADEGCKLPPPQPDHYEVAIGELIEALPISNVSAMKYWGKHIEEHVYLVSIPHDCAEIVEPAEAEPVTSADWTCQTK
jgi:hypothetical protein